MKITTGEKSKSTSNNSKRLIDRCVSSALVVVIIVAAYWVINLAMQDSLLLLTLKDVFKGMTISIINIASRC